MSWLRVPAAAAHAHVSQRTIRDWVAGGLTSYKVCGVVLIDSEELDDFIRGHRRRRFVRRHVVGNPNLQGVLRRL